MQKCLKCGNFNGDDVKYCGSCGTILDDENVVRFDENNAEQYFLNIINEKLEILQSIDSKLNVIENVALFWFILKLAAIFFGVVIFILKYDAIVSIWDMLNKIFK